MASGAWLHLTCPVDVYQAHDLCLGIMYLGTLELGEKRTDCDIVFLMLRLITEIFDLLCDAISRR